MTELDDGLKQALTLGRAYYLRKEYARAERYLTQVVEQNQSFADVYNMLGVIYHDHGQYQKAQRSFEAALRINPGYTDAALNLAVIYNDTGRYDAARETYQQALTRSGVARGEIDPFVKGKLANMYADLGDVWLSSGLYAEAAREYQRALDLCPSFIDIRARPRAARGRATAAPGGSRGSGGRSPRTRRWPCPVRPRRGASPRAGRSSSGARQGPTSSSRTSSSRGSTRASRTRGTSWCSRTSARRTAPT